MHWNKNIIKLKILEIWHWNENIIKLKILEMWHWKWKI